MRSICALVTVPALALAVLVGCDEAGSGGDGGSADTGIAPQVTNADGFAFSDIELDVHEEINAYRQSEGLPPFALDPFLGALSREHSDNMAAGVVPIGHDGFDARAELIIADGADMVGENVAFNQGYADPVEGAVEGWLASPPHHDNIVSAYFTHAGVGVTERNGAYYFTQMFSRRLDAR